METVESSRKGIQVQKAFDVEHFAVPVVVFRVESHRQDTVTVTVTDYLPKAVAAECVKAHPAFDGAHWRTTTTRSVEYERRLDPGETVVTLYAVDVLPETARTHLRGPPILSSVRAGGTTRRPNRAATAQRREPAGRAGQIAVQRDTGTGTERAAVRDGRREPGSHPSAPEGTASGGQTVSSDRTSPRPNLGRSSEERGALSGQRTSAGGRRTGRHGNRLRWSANGMGDAEALGTGDVGSRVVATEASDSRPDRSHGGRLTGDIGTVRSLPVVGLVAAAVTPLFGHLLTYLGE